MSTARKRAAAFTQLQLVLLQPYTTNGELKGYH
jgi:hypothetical protein